MGSLLAQVLPLAAGAAMSPGLLAVQMLALSQRDRGLAHAWAAAAGAAAVVAVVSVAALFVSFSLGEIGRDLTLRAIIRLVAAVALLALAAYEWRQGDAKPVKIVPTRTAAWAGLGAGLIAPNMAIFIPAAHEIARSGVGDGGKLVAFALAAGIALAPVAGPPVAVSLLGERVRPGLEALNRFVIANSRVITIVACLAFAAYLGATGVSGLAG